MGQKGRWGADTKFEEWPWEHLKERLAVARLVLPFLRGSAVDRRIDNLSIKMRKNFIREY